MAEIDLKRLRATLARIEAERDRLAQQSDHFRAVITYYEMHPGESESSGVVGKTSGKVIGDHLVNILEIAGGPLHYRELYQLLTDRGIEVPGKDPAHNVGAHLSVNDQFMSLGRGMWGLAKWQKEKPNEPSPSNNGREPSPTAA